MLITTRKILFSCHFKVNDKNVLFVQGLKSKTRKESEFVNVFATVELEEKWTKQVHPHGDH